MTMQEALKRNVEVYWWNMGRKTREHTGTFGEYLKVKGITFRKTPGGYRFQIATSSTKASVLMTGCDYGHMIEEVVALFLTMMGDKAGISSSPRGLRRFNWS
jgi:hypothetical protein